MKTKEELKLEIQDFANSRGRFASNAELLGMAASRQNDQFLQFQDKLSLKEKEGLCGLLVEAVVDNDSSLHPLRHVALDLLVSLALRGKHDGLTKWGRNLADFFADRERVDAWIAADDGSCTRDVHSWRFALSVFTILRMIRGDLVSDIHEELVARARSVEFRDALLRTDELCRRRLKRFL